MTEPTSSPDTVDPGSLNASDGTVLILEPIVYAEPHQVECRVAKMHVQGTWRAASSIHRTNGKGVAPQVHVQVFKFQGEIAGELVFGATPRGPSRRGSRIGAGKAG